MTTYGCRTCGATWQMGPTRDYVQGRQCHVCAASGLDNASIRIAELEDELDEAKQNRGIGDGDIAHALKRLDDAEARCKGLEAKCKRYEDALKFYAERSNYDKFGIIHNDPSGCSCGMRHNHPDCGHAARTALGPLV